MSFSPPKAPPPVPPEIQDSGGFINAFREAVALPVRLFNWLGQRIRSFSFAAWLAWFVFFTLVLIVIVFWFVLHHDGDVPWQQTLTVERVIVAILVVCIPFVTYHVVLNWTESVTSEFPDIQDAWNKGLSALREQNLRLDSNPLFLVIGTVNLHQERSLMAASGLQFIVEAAPAGPAPLHFYATSDAVYLILSDASYLSAVSRLVETQTPAKIKFPGAETGQHSSEIDDFAKKTLDVSTIQEQKESAHEISMEDFAKQTLDVSTFESHRERVEELRKLPIPQVADGPTLKPGGVTRQPEDVEVRLSAQEANDQIRRIRHVSKLLKTARYPFCAINGIMVLIPFKLLSINDDAVTEAQRAIKTDISSLRETLMLKVPTIAMFTGLEKEPGFRELVRRVGPVGAARQRFGQGMDIRIRPTSRELESLAAHACGAFEDWVYTLFREDGALTRPGNTLLHSLLCKVRSELKTPTTELLAIGFGNSGEHSDSEMPFAGCYFAATGESEDQRAFVKGVFDKLGVVQEELEWTSTATKQNHRVILSRLIGFICCVALSLSLAAMIYSMLS